jgi:hypothetical protein
MGSPLIAAWIAHIAFWVLLIAGVAFDELGRKAATTFVILWLAGHWGLPYLPYGAALSSSFVAVLDVALVLVVFKGDIQIR